MDQERISNAEARRLIEPWAESFADVFQTCFRAVARLTQTLGHPHQTERANVVHWALREYFKRFCALDGIDRWLDVVEEPDGGGLDFLVLKTGSEPIALRFGRWNKGCVRRNATTRTSSAVEEQLLITEFGEFDKTLGGYPHFTLAYTVEDEGSAGGAPTWWFNRVVLIRELEGDSEFIFDVAIFKKPRRLTSSIPPPPVIVGRDADVQRWQKLANKLRRRIG